MTQPATWFDGQSALERPVDVRLVAGGLLLVDAAGTEDRVGFGDLVRLDSGGPGLKYGHRAREGWRLVLAQPVDPEIEARLPRRGGALVPSARPTTMVLLAGISAIATVAAGLVIFAPAFVADHMPMEWERKIGAAYELPIEAARCNDPQADAALRQIVDRLDPAARSDGFTIELVDLGIPNAAALPGGRMVILNGLFDEVEDPDAVAGIVAHEIAHVRRRHVAASMVRELGLGTVVTLLGGGMVASNAGGLLSLKFSRSAEAEADADAVAMLSRAGIDPRPTADAFETFRRREGDWPEWLGSHPASGGRAHRFMAAYQAGRAYRPVLSPAETRALMRACRGSAPKKVRVVRQGNGKEPPILQQEL